MNDGPSLLADRREALIALAAAQRLALARDLSPWRVPLGVADRGIAAVRFLKAHPAWIVGGALLPGAMSAGRLGTWIRRGIVGLQILRRLRAKTL